MGRLSAALVVALVLSSTLAFGQNDWQYPDPHFGTLSAGTDRGPSTEREYRREIGPIGGARRQHRLMRRRAAMPRASSMRQGSFARPHGPVVIESEATSGEPLDR